ncbi:MAG: DUF4430 domain-containing protein, partial [Clostridiales bacterium]|nr:DUF4430 domain-containing protein [Clostridiales bacterium]
VTDRNQNGKFDIDDALAAAHALYAPGRSGDYEKNSSGFLLKLWGQTDGVGGYYVDDAFVSTGLFSEIHNGSRITAFTYKNTASWSDLYAYFNRSFVTVAVGGPIELELKGTSWNGTFTIDGAQLGLADSQFVNSDLTKCWENIPGKTTDSTGRVSLSFDTAGEYTVSACSTWDMSAPVCKVRVLTADEANALINSDKDALSLPSSAESDLALPSVGASGKTSITWESSDSSVISASGKITRSTSEDKTVTLTAAVGIPGAQPQTKSFSITVPKANESDVAAGQTAISAIKAALGFDVIKGANAAPYAVTGNLSLPLFASYDAAAQKASFSSESGDFSIIWNSANSAVASDGRVTQGASTSEGSISAIIHSNKLGGIIPDQTVSFNISVLNYNYYGTPDDNTLCNIVAGNIASGYVNSADTSSSAWIIADMAAANAAKAYGNSGYPQYKDIAYNLTDAQKQAYVNYAVNALTQSGADSGSLAKNIIALAALGYDARRITVLSGESFDAVAKLVSKVNTETSIYSLPYMLIAFQQFGSEYQSYIDTIIDKIVGTQFWGYGATDADGAGPAILALAPYYGNASYANVTAAIDTQIAALKNNVQINANGTVESYGTPSAESTAMLVMGLCAVGQDVRSFNGKNLVQGLLAMVQNSGKAFKTSYSEAITTEQGFRGLVAISGAKLKNGPFRIYDFSGNTLAPVTVSYKGCPVSFSVVPSDAQVAVTGQTPVSGNCFNLKAGTYSYTISKSGYTSKTGTIVISQSDEANHTPKSINVSLASEQQGTNSCTVRFTLVGDTDHDDKISHVYRKDLGAGRTWIAAQSVTVPSGSSVFDVFDKVLSSEGYTYYEKNANYIVSITNPSGQTLSEFSNGANSGWMYIVNGSSPNIPIRDYKVSNGDDIVFFFTDDYTLEKGSEQWNPPTETSKPSESLTPTVTVQQGKAEVSISTSAIESAISGSSGKVVIAPQINGTAETVSVSVPTSAVKTLAGKNSGMLCVETSAGNVNLPSKVLEAAAGQAGGENISVVIEKKQAKDVNLPETDVQNAAIVEISIVSGGKNITTFGGGALTVFVPVSGKRNVGDSYKVIVISSDGSKEILPGKIVSRNGETFAEVAVSHLSTFVVTTARVIVFDDVNSDSWYYEAVQYTAASGIMNGVSDTSFAPEVKISRAMLVTVLYRLAGSPKTEGDPSFTDVEKNTWYSDAIVWASKNGIVMGRGNGTFGTADTLTREEAAAILYRYAAFRKLDISKSADISSYKDAGILSSWAAVPMKWANAVGFIKGTTDCTLSPKESMTRAQAAAILMRVSKYSDSAPQSGTSETAKKTAEYILKTTAQPQIGYIGGDWAVIGLVRSGYQVPQAWLDGYEAEVEKYTAACKGVLSSNKYTEYSRVILALTAAGKSPKNVAGYDLTLFLADYENVIKQGLNGAIWALIALDSGKYDIPANPQAKVQATREMYLNEILSNQLSDGGFSLTGKEPADTDLTAMALCALSAYGTRIDAAAAIEKGLAYLSKKQESGGDYGSCESTAQVLIALNSLKISSSDSRFIKNGYTLVDGLMSYYANEGRFRHVKNGEVNQMATEQAMLALAAIERTEKGESALYRIK